MSYSVKKKKRNLFIPLPLECAKNLNSEILITRPLVQDEQFDTILTEINFNLWSMHALKVGGVYFGNATLGLRGIVIMHCRLDLIIVGAMLPCFYYAG